MVLYYEKSLSSLILVPAAGEASSLSGSESRVYFFGGSGICRYVLLQMQFYTWKASLKNGGWWSSLVTLLGFSSAKSREITYFFYKEETDAGQGQNTIKSHIL